MPSTCFSKMFTLVASVLCYFAMCDSLLAGGVNLFALGAEHADSGPNWITTWAGVVAPDVAGNSVFAGTWGLAVGPPGAAFGAGAGQATDAGGVLILQAQAAAAIAPTGFPGGLHAWGVGYADPAPNPFLNPLSNSALNSIFGDNGPVTVVPSETPSQYNAAVAAHPVSMAIPGSSGLFTLMATFNPTSDQLSIRISGSDTLQTFGLSTYSASLSLNSDSLGIHDSFSYDESGRFCFQGGWNASDLTVTKIGEMTTIDGSNLGFTITVPSNFSFNTSDLELETINTASVPEPGSLTLLGLGIAIALGFARRRLRAV